MQFDGEKPDKITRGACACNDDKVIFENPLIVVPLVATGAFVGINPTVSLAKIIAVTQCYSIAASRPEFWRMTGVNTNPFRYGEFDECYGASEREKTFDVGFRVFPWLSDGRIAT